HNYTWWPVYNFKHQIERDLAKNDRLYVAGAGENLSGGAGASSQDYPAAYDCVLGVTGLDASYSSGWSFSIENSSNWNWASYPVSGIFRTTDLSNSQYLPIPLGTGINPLYVYAPHDDPYVIFWGNSFATPQVS